MKLTQRPGDSADAVVALEREFDSRISELLAEANEAGYSNNEALGVLESVIKQQIFLSNHDPDSTVDQTYFESC